MSFSIKIHNLILPTFTIDDQRAGRQTFDLDANETVSTLDVLFEEDRRQINALTSKTPREMIAVSKKVIGDHFAERVQAAFQQCIACYGTGFTFEIGETEAQGPRARQLPKVPFEAAHAGTIPCVYATNTEGVKFFLFKYSDMYMRGNSTVEIVKAANEADSLIDGKANGKLARVKLLSILNQLSKKETTPVEALQKFHQDLTTCVENALSNSSNEEAKIVLEIYKENLAKLTETMQRKSHIFFDVLLNVAHEVSNAPTKREEIYQKRYQQIQEQFAIQSALHKKIHDLQKAILNGSKKLAYFDHIFKRHLVAACPEALRPKLCITLATSPDALRVEPPRKYPALQKKMRDAEDLLKRDAANLIPLLNQVSIS